MIYSTYSTPPQKHTLRFNMGPRIRHIQQLSRKYFPWKRQFFRDRKRERERERKRTHFSFKGPLFFKQVLFQSGCTTSPAFPCRTGGLGWGVGGGFDECSLTGEFGGERGWGDVEEIPCCRVENWFLQCFSPSYLKPELVNNQLSKS